MHVGDNRVNFFDILNDFHTAVHHRWTWGTVLLGGHYTIIPMLTKLVFSELMNVL